MDHEIREFWPHDLRQSPLNCRPEDDDISELEASIAHRGLLQPLVGQLQSDDTAEIVAGGRRLKALQRLFDDGRRQERVKVILLADIADVDAYEASLAENVTRKPLHPVTEFEAFAALIEKGRTPQDVAEHFGLTLRQVEQRLALGRLHPEVRKAWQQGRITGEAARAFTIATPAAQADYLAKAQHSWQLQPGQIGGAFKHDTVPADRPIAVFVGAEAYLAAGGEMVRDLFVEQPDFADGALLRRLAEEKLAAEAERIREAEGWAQVLHGDDGDGRHSWQRLTKPALPDMAKPPRRIEIETRLREIDERTEEIEGELEEAGYDGHDEGETLPPEIAELIDESDRLAAERMPLSLEHKQFDDEATAWLSLPAEERAKAVAVIEIDSDGGLQIARGYLKGVKHEAPRTAPASALRSPAPAPAGEEAPPELEPVRLSAALLDDLALTATRAAAHVLAEHPRIAFAALIAAQVSYGAPVRLDNHGRQEGPSLGWQPRRHGEAADFSEAFRTCLALAPERLEQLVARFVAQTLDFTSKAIDRYGYDNLKPEAVQDLRCALPLDEHRKALVAAFDAAAYFTAAPKTEAIAAIEDCGDNAAKHGKLKKPDLIALAARLAGEHGWLPPLLRGEIFDATAPLPRLEPGDEAAPSAGLIEAEAHLSAAEAALQIWAGKMSTPEQVLQQIESTRAEAIDLGILTADEAPADRVVFQAMKTQALRSLLKERGVTVPFGSTREVMIDLACGSDSTAEEAA